MNQKKSIYFRDSDFEEYDRNRAKSITFKSILSIQLMRLRFGNTNPYLVAIHDFLIEYVVGENLSYVFDDENETEQRDIAFISLYDKVQKYLTSVMKLDNPIKTTR